MYKQAAGAQQAAEGAAPQGGGDQEAKPGGKGDDDVIDAEYEVKE